MDCDDDKTPSPGPGDVLPSGTPLVDDNGTAKDIGMMAAGSSVVTLKPFSSLPRNNSRKGKYQIVPGVFVPSTFDKYLTIDLSSTNVDIFEINRDIKKCCGRELKISQNANKLIVETTSAEESNKLKNLTSLGGISVECTPHFSMNHSRGIIYAPQLMMYSEEKLLNEFEEQGVIKVERMKKKIDGALTPQPSLLLTFNSIRLPSILKAAWFKYEVKQYIPRPRRCFHCQNFGHILTSCRLKSQGKPAVCVNCGEVEHGDCQDDPTCIHCGGDHPSSSHKCDVFRFELEVQATRIRERITFKEAKDKVRNQSIRPGVTFAKVTADSRAFKNSKFNGRQNSSNPGVYNNKQNVNESKRPLKGSSSESSLPDLEDFSNQRKKKSAKRVTLSMPTRIDVSTPAVAGASASSEAVSAVADASASFEAVSAAADTSASSEATPAVTGASASLEAGAPVTAGTPATLKVAATGPRPSTSSEVASTAEGMSDDTPSVKKSTK